MEAGRYSEAIAAYKRALQVEVPAEYADEFYRHDSVLALYKIALSQERMGWDYYAYRTYQNTLEWLDDETPTFKSQEARTKSRSLRSKIVTALARNRPGQVTASKNCNIRSGPSTEYSVIGSLQQGLVYPYDILSEDWYRVPLYSGGYGYFSTFCTR